jgi:hypothetical protein
MSVSLSQKSAVGLLQKDWISLSILCFEFHQMFWILWFPHWILNPRSKCLPSLTRRSNPSRPGTAPHSCPRLKRASCVFEPRQQRERHKRVEKKRKKYTRRHKTIRNSCVQNCCACSTLIQRCLLDLVELTKDLCLTKTVLNLSLHNTKFGPLFPRVAWEVEVYANLNDIQAILPWLKAFVSHFHLAWEGSLIWVWHILGPISGMWEELEDHSAYSFLDGGNDTTYATSWPISLLHFHNVRKWKEIYDII